MSIFKIENNNKFDIFSKDFWIRILIMTIAIWIVSFTGLVKSHDGPQYLLLAAIIISLLNAFVRPILSLISMPLIVGTFGFFMLVINAIIILLTSFLLSPHFVVSGFLNALLFSIIVTVLYFLMNIPLKIKKIQDNVFSHNNNQNNRQENINENNNQGNKSSSSNRFDDNPFNDNPEDKNYTDFEDIN